MEDLYRVNKLMKVAPFHESLKTLTFKTLASDIVIKKDVTTILFCCVALRPKSTAMVIVGRSVHLTTLFPGQA